MHSYCLSATDLGDDKDVLGRDAHLARLGEIAWAMTDAGIVLVAALGDMDRFDLDRLRRLAAPHDVYVVSIEAGADLGADLELSTGVVSRRGGGGGAARPDRRRRAARVRRLSGTAGPG